MADSGALRPVPSLERVRVRASGARGRLGTSSGLALAAAATLLLTFLWHPRPLLLWNATPSSPVGLYSVAPPLKLRAGDTVVAWPPGPARRLAAERNYLPSDVPLVKRVAAEAGDRVCASGKRIIVNGRAVAARRRRDPKGRPMPWWTGCRMLRGRELFLLTRGEPRAFDGRYFGVTGAGEIVGKARLLWAR